MEILPAVLRNHRTPPVSPDLLLIIASHCKRCERARKEQQLFSSVLRRSAFKIVVRP